MSNPIFVTSVERSGASFIARVIAMSGGCFIGSIDRRYENFVLKYLIEHLPIDDTILTPFKKASHAPDNFKTTILDNLKYQGLSPRHKWMFKHAALTRNWEIFHANFPNAKWVIVRRAEQDIVNACIKTAYMTQMKDKTNLKLIGATNEKTGWKWWINRYEGQWNLMRQAGVQYMEVWPQQMADGDFTKVREMVQWLGLRWNEKIPNTITSLMNKEGKRYGSKSIHR